MNPCLSLRHPFIHPSIHPSMCPAPLRPRLVAVLPWACALLGALAGADAQAVANDLFANRQLISGSSGQVTGSNVGATREPGEPFHFEDSGTRSVWWKWVAPASGTVTFTTAGSSFDTVMAGYSGTTLAGLVKLASGDDADGAITSAISFDVQAGVEYQIAVDGFGNPDSASGSIVLNWRLGQSQSITIAPLSNQVLGAGPLPVGATASSGLPVTLASLTTSVCTFNGNLLSLVGVGTCTIVADQAGNATYLAAPRASASFGISAPATGEVPLPPWSLLLLAATLTGTLRRGRPGA